MQRRQWDAKAKAKAAIVLMGLRGKPVAGICTEHQISQSQYYLWRDQFLANMLKVFKNDERREQTLFHENTRLKAIRKPRKSKPRTDRPNQWWGIDMTKVMVGVFGGRSIE